MSVQFGRWSFDGQPAAPGYFEKVEALLVPYGPDRGNSYSAAGVDILFHAFHTTKESRRETQPHLAPSGAVITWDGRLDNRSELISQMRDVVASDCTDVSIVAAAFERWGTGCFAKLVGDWALSVWTLSCRTLILAKDFVGVRQLYFTLDEQQLTWSTILDPLVLLAERPVAIDEEYIAGWLGFFPAAHLTPYRSIRAVPPASYVLLRDRKATIHLYWNFDPGKKSHYRTDAEYEEHFRVAFAESVRRRLRSNTPILAELSGGMDSSSIVCMADRVLAEGRGETPRLDTISYYDDSEPNWNERPYFVKVEERRGRAGCHIDVGAELHLSFERDNDRFAATPASRLYSTDGPKEFSAFLASHGNRAILSGIGGDEALGGVPSPIPELADLLATGDLQPLARQMVAWALVKRKPLLHLMAEIVRVFLPRALAGGPNPPRAAAWLQPEFARRHRGALEGYERRIRIFGPLPSFQENLNTLDGLRRQLACSPLSSEPPFEKRYPYLDRDFLEFIYTIPREQLVRPHQRRSLMRRALAGIVPNEILNRKRKAFVVRGPLAAVSTHWPTVVAMTEQMVSDSLGIVRPARFAQVLETARSGQETPIVPLMRTLRIESWLRHLEDWGFSGSHNSPATVQGTRRESTEQLRAASPST